MAHIHLNKPITVGKLIEYLKQFDPSLLVEIDAVADEYIINAIYDYSDHPWDKKIVINGGR